MSPQMEDYYFELTFREQSMMVDYFYLYQISNPISNASYGSCYHFTGFYTTTDSSAPVIHILTFILANMLACIFHLSLYDKILLFPFRACCRTTVTSTPTAAYPVNRFPIDLYPIVHTIQWF